MRASVVMAVLLLLGGNAQAASTPTTPEAEQQARRSFERAEASFRAGLYAEALADYQAGYDIAALPGFLINIAQCQRRLGDLKDARISYRKFLMVAPDSHFIPEVTKLIVELDDLLNDSEEGNLLPAANHTPTETKAADGSTHQASPQRPFPPAAGRTVNPGASLVSVPATPAASTGTGRRWLLWGTVGAAVVVAATVAVLVLRDPGTHTLQAGSLGTLKR